MLQKTVLQIFVVDLVLFGLLITEENNCSLTSKSEDDLRSLFHVIGTYFGIRDLKVS